MNGLHFFVVQLKEKEWDSYLREGSFDWLNTTIKPTIILKALKIRAIFSADCTEMYNNVRYYIHIWYYTWSLYAGIIIYVDMNLTEYMVHRCDLFHNVF